MSCDKCGSKRVAHLYAHSKDCSDFVCETDGIMSENTYFPDIPNICDGDDVQMNICLECGKVQGKFPVVIEKQEGVLLRGEIVNACKLGIIEADQNGDEERADKLDDIVRVLTGNGRLADFPSFEIWEIPEMIPHEELIAEIFNFSYSDYD